MRILECANAHYKGASRIRTFYCPVFFIMNIIFQINGGLGKCVASTAICKSIKTKYPSSNLIVIAGYPDVYINNPYVDRCIKHNENKYFFKDFIEGKDFLYLGQEPYLENSHIKSQKHLIETWCSLFDLPIDKIQGEIYLTKREIDFYSRKYQFSKPTLLLQTSGSSGEIMYNWTRDIPPVFAKKIIKKFSDYEILHIKGENQISYNGAIPFTDNIRAVSVMILLSQKRIFMDSCAQHISSSLGLSSNVFWIGTDPKVFGYDINKNIVANEETKKISLQNSFLHKYDLVGNIIDFPYNNEDDIFNEEVLDTLI